MVLPEHSEHTSLVIEVEMKKLSQARIPSNRRTMDSLRISAKIHWWSGIRLRHSDIIVGAESTPVTCKP
jgi:hypothetical protein